MVTLPRGSAGWTLVETLFVVAAVAVGLGLAVPSYTSAVERRTAVSAAEQFSDFVANARQLAVTRNRVVTVAVDATDAGGWCVGAGLGPEPCDCGAEEGPRACRVGGVRQALGAWEVGEVAIDAVGDAPAWRIDPTTGYKHGPDLVGDHRFRFSVGSGRAVTEVAVTASGLATVCVPEGANAIGGVYRCTRDSGQEGGGALAR